MEKPKNNDIGGLEEEYSPPKCPHGDWSCPYPFSIEMFKRHRGEYMGHLPLCRLCVGWAIVKQLMKMTGALEILRYTT